jgi:hypothetical protein
MKKTLIVILLAVSVFLVPPAFAAWTSTPSAPIAQSHGDFYVVELLFTCDGSASGTLYLETVMGSDAFGKVNGKSLYSVSVSPGTSSVAPDAAYDVNVYDSNGTQTIDATTTSEATKHTYNTYDITGVIQQVLGSIPFDIGDLGTSGDQVTIRFNFK